MKMIWRLSVGLFLSAFVISCFSPPEYPLEPKIEFESIKFVDVPDGATLPPPGGGTIPDTLILKVKFKDGDGNIGLSNADDGIEEYAERFYFSKTGTPLPKNGPIETTDSKLDSYLRYLANDTLPAFNSVTECTNYQVIQRPVDPKKPTDPLDYDTLYFQLNPNRFNIFVRFFKDTGIMNPSTGNTFKEYDFMKELCTTYDGRLPILSKDLSVDTPLEGTIRYNITGTGFKFVFGNTPMRLRVQIQDRTLNKSNVIETETFTLSSIK